MNLVPTHFPSIPTNDKTEYISFASWQQQDEQVHISLDLLLSLSLSLSSAAFIRQANKSLLF